MKKGIGAALLCLLLLMAGCARETEPPSVENMEITNYAEHLHILLPYGTAENSVELRSDAFQMALREALARQGWGVNDLSVSVANSAAASGKAIDDGTADLVIMPASTYFTYNDDVSLLMTATKPGLSVSSVNAEDWNGSVESPIYTSEDCVYSRTLICTAPSEKGRVIAQAAKNGTLTWEQLEDAQWLYPKCESSSDFLYPDLWLTPTFGKTLNDLPNIVQIDGYAALFSEAAAGNADVLVIAADRRIDYATAWQIEKDEIDYTGKMGLGQIDSIFNEVRVIGVTGPIYGDVMVLRNSEAPFDNADFRRALTLAMDALEKDRDARVLWSACGYTGFSPSQEINYENIRELPLYSAAD